MATMAILRLIGPVQVSIFRQRVIVEFVAIV